MNPEKQMAFYLDSVLLNLDTYTVNVFGAGGTGSHLIAQLATVAYALGETLGKQIRLTAYDFDRVDKRNVGRSDFIEGDTDLEKTVVAISKANISYGLNWKSRCTDHTFGLGPAHFTFICTDSAKSRELIREATVSFKDADPDARPYYIFDIGNDRDFGQITVTDVLGRLRDIERSGLTSESLGTETCGERPLFAEQGLFINQFMAMLTAEMFWTLLTQYNLDYNQLFANLTMMKINTKLEWEK
jgi:hypothetical protein